MTTRKAYREQYDRMLRAHARAVAFRAGFPLVEVPISPALLNVMLNPRPDGKGNGVVHLSTPEVDAEFCRVMKAAYRIDDVNDALRTFFIECFALKDWIKNDPAGSGVDVEAHVHQSADLTLARDICNGAKHLVFRSGREVPVPVAKRFESDTRKPGPITVEAFATVPVNGVEQDAFALADACCAEWTSFLTARGLL